MHVSQVDSSFATSDQKIFRDDAGLLDEIKKNTCYLTVNPQNSVCPRRPMNQILSICSSQLVVVLFAVLSSISSIRLAPTTRASHQPLLDTQAVVQTEMPSPPAAAPPDTEPVREAANNGDDAEHCEQRPVDEAEANVPEDLFEGRNGVLCANGGGAVGGNLGEGVEDGRT